MKASNYRREYAAYCSALERERYRHHAGFEAALRLDAINDRYDDLWTRDAVDHLLHALEEPTQFETERAALRALAGAARLGYMRVRTREMAGELARCESSARVKWGEEKISSDEARESAAFETDFLRRRDLVARWYDALRSCDDLRAAFLDSSRETAGALGFTDALTLRAEVADVDYEKLAASADAFLRRTAPLYFSQLATRTARELPPGIARTPELADSFFLMRLPHLEQFFPARDLTGFYATTLEGLGIRVEKQPNIRVDNLPRASKRPYAASFGIKPPEEVTLVVGARGGADSYLALLRAAGRAQSFAWSSRDLTARYPEFIHSPDGATREGHALLLGGLLREAGWLVRHLNLKLTDAHEVASAVALRELYEVRRCCAALRYAMTARDAKDVRSEHLLETYVAAYSEATGFRHHAATALPDLLDAHEASIRLRAWLLAASLSEYLRERHGRRWWATRAAGDELIDIWNTSEQYPAEDLARSVGAGEPDFDLLADTLTAALEGR